MILNEKGILQEFDLVVYPVQLVIAIGSLEQEINRLYKPYDPAYNHIGLPEGNPAATYQVKNKKTDDNCCLIWLPDTQQVRGSYLCHEAGHVTLEVFKYVGAHIDYDNQEPFCYLLGTVFRLINGAFYEWKGYMNKKKAKDASVFRVELISFLQDCKNKFNTEKDIDYFLDKWTPRLLEAASKTKKK